MAVVPDRRIAITHKLKMLKTNRAIVTAALEKLLNTKNSPNSSDSKNGENSELKKDETFNSSSQSTYFEKDPNKRKAENDLLGQATRLDQGTNKFLSFFLEEN